MLKAEEGEESGTEAPKTYKLLIRMGSNDSGQEALGCFDGLPARHARRTVFGRMRSVMSNGQLTTQIVVRFVLRLDRVVEEVWLKKTLQSK